jgi:hypothetical protein
MIERIRGITQNQERLKALADMSKSQKGLIEAANETAKWCNDARAYRNEFSYSLGYLVLVFPVLIDYVEKWSDP